MEATTDTEYIINIGCRVIETLGHNINTAPHLVYVRLSNDYSGREGLFFICFSGTFFYSNYVGIGNYSEIEKEYKRINLEKIFHAESFIELYEHELKSTDNNHSLYEKPHENIKIIRYNHENIHGILKTNDISSKLNEEIKNMLKIASKNKKIILLEYARIISRDYRNYREYYIGLLHIQNFKKAVEEIFKIRKLFGKKDFDTRNLAYCLKMLGDYEKALIEYNTLPENCVDELVKQEITTCRKMLEEKRC